MYPFKASIVMAVYNVEPFLREAIDSVIHQDIGFQNIQLILVDDGSTDGSKDICDEYGKLYPENLVVLHQENSGVSSARNEGLKHVRGQYVNFMDADDMLSPNTVSIIYNFFTEHREETDVVAFPMVFFDGQKGQHKLNYKFKSGDRIIDLDVEWQNPQLSMSSTFVKAECIAAYQFDTRLAFAEDAQVMQKLLAPKAALGVVNGAQYMYRRRSEGESSAIQSSEIRKEWYLPYMLYFQKETVNYYLEKYTYVPRFIQNTLMYDLQWRIKQPQIPADVLTQEETDKFHAMVCEVLQYIDDDVIMAQRNLLREHKYFTLCLKYGREPVPVMRESDATLVFPSGGIFKISQCLTLLEFLEPNENGITLEGSVFLLAYPWQNIEVFVRSNGVLNLCDVNTLPDTTIAWGKRLLHKITFRSSIAIDKTCSNHMEIILSINGVHVSLQNLKFGQFFPLTSAYNSSYAHVGSWVVEAAPNGIHITYDQNVNIKALEKKFCSELWKKNAKGCRNAVIARYLSRVLRKLKRRPIWLISDRASKAGDNGEAMFRFMRENHTEIDCYFVINSDSPDYKRMKKIGPVLAKDSRQHKSILLISDFVISSHAEIDI